MYIYIYNIIYYYYCYYNYIYIYTYFQYFAAAALWIWHAFTDSLKCPNTLHCLKHIWLDYLGLIYHSNQIMAFIFVEHPNRTYITYTLGWFGWFGFSYPLVNVYITMERSTIFHGKIHYFNWAMASIANCWHNQRVWFTIQPRFPHSNPWRMASLYRWPRYPAPAKWSSHGCNPLDLGYLGRAHGVL